MSRHNDSVYFRHMLDHAEAAVAITRDKGRNALETEPLVRYALLHLMCILGEAANRVSAEGRATAESVPWRNLISMRNVLIHGYDTVDLDVLWKTVTEDLPALINVLRECAAEDASGQLS